MDVIKAMETFVAVADLQGFAAAARALDLSTTAVSRHIQEFEDWHGAQLFRRTTRKISLTEAGENQLENCRRIVGEVHAMQTNSKAQSTNPAGKLRITAPTYVARHFLAELLPGFLNKFPEVSIDLVVVDREVDLVAEGFDLALRIGSLADSTLRARKVCDVSMCLIASPDYLATQGTPTTVRDLSTHNCIVDTIPEHGSRWPLADPSFKKGFRANGNIQVNNGEIAEFLAVNGVGIAYLPDFFVSEQISDGRLLRLLSDLKFPQIGMYLVYPQSRRLPSKTRSFIDFTVQSLKTSGTSIDIKTGTARQAGL